MPLFAALGLSLSLLSMIAVEQKLDAFEHISHQDIPNS
jgi:hypothetical protein